MTETGVQPSPYGNTAISSRMPAKQYRGLNFDPLQQRTQREGGGENSDGYGKCGNVKAEADIMKVRIISSHQRFVG